MGERRLMMREDRRGAIRALINQYKMTNPRYVSPQLAIRTNQGRGIDIVVDPLPGLTYFEIGELEVALEKELNKKVRIISARGLSSQMHDLVVKTARPL